MRPGALRLAGLLMLASIPRTGVPIPVHRGGQAALDAHHPLLLVTRRADPFTQYLAAILLAEGFNGFEEADIAQMDSAMLVSHTTVVLGKMPVDDVQAGRLARWVRGGGVLIAMRPDPRLRSLLGLGEHSGTLADAYLRVDSTLASSRGITGATMQFHGEADLYAPGSATPVALLHATRAGNGGERSPAVSVRAVGSRGGAAVAFTFDVARSIVYTRQGNPSWAGQERDGRPPRRPNDLFYPDYLDMERVAIPQADELQRLLSNLIVHLGSAHVPVPRFWYLPRGLKAAVLMAGDDHGTHDGTRRFFDMLVGASVPGCRVDAWECQRATSWIYDDVPLTDSAKAAYVAMGFELGSHIRARLDDSKECPDWTPSTLDGAIQRDLLSFRRHSPSVPIQKTLRVHCIVWSDWSTMPKVERAHGIMLDMNYYYSPPEWIRLRQGYMTGSALPMPYADLDGALLGVYQAPTHIVNTNGRAQRAGIEAMLQHAVGPDGYTGIFGAHVDFTDGVAGQVLRAALAKGIPLVSAVQVLDWTAARDASRFEGVSWAGSTLSFTVSAAVGARQLVGMLPTRAGRRQLDRILFDGRTVPVTARRFKGLDYATFPALSGAYRAEYR